MQTDGHSIDDDGENDAIDIIDSDERQRNSNSTTTASDAVASQVRLRSSRNICPVDDAGEGIPDDDDDDDFDDRGNRGYGNEETAQHEQQ